MLYDPKCEKTETKSDPFALGTLIAWLEKQPAHRAYNYNCNGHCLLAQYFTAQGFEKVCVGGSFFCTANTTHDLPAHFNDIAVDAMHSPRRLTFGAALERARAI